MNNVGYLSNTSNHAIKNKQVKTIREDFTEKKL